MGKAKGQVSPSSFEEALKELEQIVDLLEEGNSTLDQSLTRFERGISLVRFCWDQLERAEKRIEFLGKGVVPPPVENEEE